MLINKDSVIVDGVSMAQYCKSIRFGYHKVWGKDTGRNNAGDNSGTLLGKYPKLTFTFHRLYEEDIGKLLAIFNKEEIKVSFYNPDLKKMVYNMSCYANDQEYEQKDFGFIDGYSSAVIANRKREYYV